MIGIEQSVRNLERATRGNGGGPRLDLSRLSDAELYVIMGPAYPLDGQSDCEELGAALREDPERLWPILHRVRLGGERLPPLLIDSWAECLIDDWELEAETAKEATT